VSNPKWEVPEPTPEHYARCLMFHSKEEAQAFVAELRELRKLPEAMSDVIEALEARDCYAPEIKGAKEHLVACEGATEKRQAATEEGKTRGLRKDAENDPVGKMW